MDDGTAVARCVFWTPSAAQEDSIQLGRMFRVQGRPSVYRGALQITTNTIRACPGSFTRGDVCPSVDQSPPERGSPPLSTDGSPLVVGRYRCVWLEACVVRVVAEYTAGTDDGDYDACVECVRAELEQDPDGETLHWLDAMHLAHTVYGLRPDVEPVVQVVRPQHEHPPLP